MVGSLARKRPSPLLKGKESVWAAAAVDAVGRGNFLDDPSQVPHFKPKALYEFFDVAESTGQNKSRQIREAFGMAPVELQRLAYEKGLIPFIPAKRSDPDA